MLPSITSFSFQLRPYCCCMNSHCVNHALQAHKALLLRLWSCHACRAALPTDTQNVCNTTTSASTTYTSLRHTHATVLYVLCVQFGISALMPDDPQATHISCFGAGTQLYAAPEVRYAAHEAHCTPKSEQGRHVPTPPPT